MTLKRHLTVSTDRLGVGHHVIEVSDLFSLKLAISDLFFVRLKRFPSFYPKKVAIS